MNFFENMDRIIARSPPLPPAIKRIAANWIGRSCRQLCLVPIAPRSGARALRSELPSLARAADRNPPAVGSTGGFGDCPLLSRLSRPGIGTEQQGNRRGAETAASADFGHELGIDALLLPIIGDDIGLEQRVDGLVGVATDQGFPFYRAMGAIYRGWVKAKNADVTEGLSLLHAGSSAYCATGATVWVPLYVALLAGACEIAGQIEGGAARLDQALQLVERTGERWFAAELDRQRGRLLLRQGHPEGARELYRKALSIARKQEAKLWEWS